MIHILTFHNALNYGAVLQCYALYSKIREMDNCDVLDYLADRKKTYSSFKGFLKSLIIARRQRIKRNKFDEFIKANITLSQGFSSYEELCRYGWGKNDKFCVGSDQVWNWDFVGEDEAYRLSFVPDGLKKFSYAASFGCELDFTHIKIMKDRLAGFSGVSVREMSALKDLQENGVSCQQNIDPVFLLTKTEWKNISKRVENENSPYVLVYLLQKAPHLLQYAEKYAKEHGLRIVFISTGVKRDISAEYVVTCGPDEFVRYFSKAEAVITNSFHGISFSIIFNKIFFFEYLQDGTKTNGRIRDITEMFSLQEQNIEINKDGKCTADYEWINGEIGKKRKESVRYLESCVCE